MYTFLLFVLQVSQFFTNLLNVPICIFVALQFHQDYSLGALNMRNFLNAISMILAAKSHWPRDGLTKLNPAES